MPALFPSMDKVCTVELVRLPLAIVLLEIEAAQQSPSNAGAACLCPYAYGKGLKGEGDDDERRVAMRRLDKVITRMRLRRQGHFAFIRFEVMGPPILVAFLPLQASWRWLSMGLCLNLSLCV